MKESINAAMGAAMEEIAADANLKDSLGGKLGKAVRSGLASGAFICAGLFAAATPAMAADNAINGGCVIGAIAGGLLGSKIGDGSGQKVATGLGAVIGCKSGQDVQANSEYRQQRQAGYSNGRYAEPPRHSRGQPQYHDPVVSARPMQSYMPNVFDQIDGRSRPGRPLETQGRMAMEKALADAERAMEQNIRAQQNYAQAYRQHDQAQMNNMNPEAQVLMGTGAMRSAVQQSANQLNQMARQQMQANQNFGSNGMKLADLAEFQAARGFDITPYAGRLMTVLNAPMSEPVTGVNPSRQRVTFATPSAMRHNGQF